MKRLLAILCLSPLLFGLLPPAVDGCVGNWIPDSIFSRPLKQKTLALPEPYFNREVRRLLDLPETGLNAYPGRDNWMAQEEAERTFGNPEQRTLNAELKDLKQVLLAQGLDDAATSASLEAYQQNRLTLKRANPPAFIPIEFVIYCEGAAAYRDEDYSRSVECWKALLALPEAERKYKSTWAAFMIGKSLLESDTPQAIQAFEQCRVLAAAGFADTAGLAPNSLGWQARGELMTQRPDLALRHYAEQAKIPAISGTDYNSLWAASTKISLNPSMVAAVINDPLCRPILTAYVLSGSSRLEYYVERHPIPNWLALIEQGNLEIPVAEVEDLAWIAYNNGMFDDARRWLARTPEHQPLGRWLLAKLMLHDGQIDSAVMELEALRVIFQNEPLYGENMYPVDSPYRSVCADLGAIYLGQEKYSQALDAFVAAGRWEDIMYLAEHVVSSDEIESYLLTHTSDKDLGREHISRLENNLDFNLHYLLARRLVREGKFTQARRHFEHVAIKIPTYDENWKKTGEITLLSCFDHLVAFQQQANDLKIGNHARALALFEAAKLTREWGMELMGAEGDPDWSVAGGAFTDWDPVEYRIHGQGPSYWYDQQPYRINAQRSRASLAANTPLDDVLAVKPSERLRVLESEIFPDKRFHYRYLASDMMWRVALMLPRNDELGTQAAWFAGRYGSRSELIRRRGFKALALRNPLLPAGQQAAKNGNLPDNEPLRNPPVAENVILYVDARHGDDVNDGRSWRQAKRTIDEAADTAADVIAAGGSASIWVARGTYRERLLMRTGVAIHGGFAGTEIELAQRVIDPLDPSRIDGSQARNGRPAYHVVEASAITTATLDGFTIIGGSASGARSDANGGGIFCENLDTSVLIQNCMISGNRADLRGAGIYCVAASPRIVACSMVGNRAEDGGGGIAFERTTSATLTACTIVDNAAAYGSGAGIYCEASNPTFSACRIVGNWCGADSGGGLMLIDSSPRLENCLIAGNSAATRGGAAKLNQSFLTLLFCTVADNHAGEKIGGLDFAGTNSWDDYYSPPEPRPGVGSMLAHCIFANNDRIAMTQPRSPLTHSLFSANPDGLLLNPAASNWGTTAPLALLTAEAFAQAVPDATGNLDGDAMFVMQGDDAYTGKWSSEPVYDRETNTTRLVDNWAWFTGKLHPGDLIKPNDAGRTAALILAVPDRRTLVLAGDLSRRVKAGSPYRRIDYHPEPQSGALNQPLGEPLMATDLTGRQRDIKQGKGALGAYAP